ncbi:hypothetical protein JHK86_000568 [Glycine max]|nr:hypothetical protein JHK86_000568 [Glycine max]
MKTLTTTLEGKADQVVPWWIEPKSKGLENYELRRRQMYCWYKEGSLFKDDDAVDPHLERIKNEVGGDESDEEDSDFVADKDDEGSPTDDSRANDFDDSKPAKKESKKDLPSKASTSKKKSKDDEDGKKKKDPNAPKREMSGFIKNLAFVHENSSSHHVSV